MFARFFLAFNEWRNGSFYRRIDDKNGDSLLNSECKTPVEKSERRKDLSVGRLLALTCCIGGLQVVWSVVLSNGTSYLISLSLSQLDTTVVWMSGPLSGVFINPLIGILSDRSRCSWGRRRPFIVFGTLGSVAAMLTLVWIVEITHTLVSMFGSSDIEFQRTLVMISAAVLILALNIAIQPVQLGMRVLMIENVPKHQQGTVSACTSYVTGIGSILGLVAGATELSKWLPCFQGTQFQGLTLIASFALTISVMVTCLAAKEENPRILPSTVSPISFSRVLRGLIRTYMTMSNNIKKVCQIQYWAWMGWFPFLYYATTYVGDLYTMNTLANYPSMKLQDRRGLHDESARVGSFAYLLFSCNTLVTNIMLSIVLSRISETSFARVWTSAHLVFAICMFLTLFVTRWTGGMVIVTLAGISWAVTLWVPYAIIGLELAAQADDDHDEDQKGSIVSLHNVALSAPQILAALLGSAIFWIYQQMGSNDGVGWALRAGGCIVLVATYLASRLDT